MCIRDRFCIAYCGILSRHNICATGTTGKMVSEATGLNITRYMSGSQGGDQQISARIACDEIDLLLFFRDPMTVKAHEPNESDMLSLIHIYTGVCRNRRAARQSRSVCHPGTGNAVRPRDYGRFLYRHGAALGQAVGVFKTLSLKSFIRFPEFLSFRGNF